MEFPFAWPARLLFIRGLLVVIGGFMVHLTLGTIYTFGNMAPYIVSYIHNRSHPEDLPHSTVSWIFACALMGQGGAMFLGGFLNNKIGPRWTTLIGGWIMSVGVALSYFGVKVSFWLLLLTYGLLFGVGVGIAYVGPLSAAMKWMPKWKGFANGIVVAGFGFGALIFDTVQTTFINPHNLKADSSDGNDQHFFTNEALLNRVPITFLLLSGIYAVMQLVGSLLITDPPDSYYQSPTDSLITSTLYREVDDTQQCGYSNDTSVQNSPEPPEVTSREVQQPDDSLPSTASGAVSPSRDPASLNQLDHSDSSDEVPDNEKLQLLHEDDLEKEKKERPSSNPALESSSKSWTTNLLANLSPKQMLHKLNFYMLWLMFMFNGIAVLFIATLYKFFGITVVNNDHFLAVVGSVSAIFNCLGRIVWGVIADQVSYKFALVILSGIFTVFNLTFFASILGGKWMFAGWVCVIFFCIGGNFSLFPTAIGRAFGLKYVAVNYGLLFTSQIVAGSLGALLSTLLYKWIGFFGLMFVVSGFTFAALVLALIYRPKRYISLLYA